MAKEIIMNFMIVSGLILAAIGIITFILLIRGLQANQAPVDVVEESIFNSTTATKTGDFILTSTVEIMIQ